MILTKIISNAESLELSMKKMVGDIKGVFSTLEYNNVNSFSFRNNHDQPGHLDSNEMKLQNRQNNELTSYSLEKNRHTRQAIAEVKDSVQCISRSENFNCETEKGLSQSKDIKFKTYNSQNTSLKYDFIPSIGSNDNI